MKWTFEGRVAVILIVLLTINFCRIVINFLAEKWIGLC